MVIAAGHDDKDRPILVLGLEDGNLERLRKGLPIFRDLAEFGRPDLGTVIIVWGVTASEIVEKIRPEADCNDAHTMIETAPS